MNIMKAEILEYHEASAKYLKHEKNYAHGLVRINGKMYQTDDTPFGAYQYPLWNPDTDLNQMGMIEDKLIEEGCRIIHEYKLRDKKWKIDIYSTFADGVMLDKSKPIAFMRAFMEYIR